VFGGVSAINRHGEVAGQSDLAGDQAAHPYLWDGRRMIDLGTLGGDNGSANAVNGAGVVAGTADLADGTHRGFIWADGRMHDLPPVNGRPCSFSTSVNDRGQAVGSSTICHPGPMEATLWRHGSAVDLNTLVAPSPLHLNAASFINDAGDIVGEATLPDGRMRNFVLVPNR
jgi:probable HAF family extracellular repeat protein